ncbi:uncharacterized protein [Arachis hypogaea]|uniref:uncharacterized protein n=1 Tax=Arachis hypogaea TaxID=3818 RepID=UPI003B226B82
MSPTFIPISRPFPSRASRALIIAASLCAKNLHSSFICFSGIANRLLLGSKSVFVNFLCITKVTSTPFSEAIITLKISGSSGISLFVVDVDANVDPVEGDVNANVDVEGNVNVDSVEGDVNANVDPDDADVDANVDSVEGDDAAFFLFSFLLPLFSFMRSFPREWCSFNALENLLSTARSSSQ